MLARWRADVSKWLTLEAAGSRIVPEYRPCVRLAWTFLTRAGYINFGVAEDIAGRRMERGKDFVSRTVVIIGAGLAGKVLLV